MLFSNKAHHKAPFTLKNGTQLDTIQLGETGRGRNRLLLPTITDIPQGFDPYISVGFSRTERPKLIKRKDKKLYLLLDCQGHYTRNTHGTILFTSVDTGLMDGEEEVKPEPKLKPLVTGNGAYGEAGRTGSWDVGLYEVVTDEGFYFIVKMSGARSANTLYYIYPNKENVVELGDLDGCSTHYKGYEVELGNLCLTAIDSYDIETPNNSWVGV